MSEVVWTRCFQHGTAFCNIDLADYYTSGTPTPGWRDRLLTKIESGLARLEAGLAEGLFKRGDYSVYSGTSGLVLLYLRLSETVYRDNPTRKRQVLARAQELITKPLNHLNGRRLTFLCGDGGVLALAAVIYTLNGNKPVAKHCTQGLHTLSELALSDRHLPFELMYGCVGYLFSLLFLRHYLPDSVDNRLIGRISAYIISAGKRDTAGPLMYTWHEKHYLGAAHGLAGILLTLLHSGSVPRDQLDSHVIPAVNYLLSQRHPSNNLRSSLGSQLDKLVQWCHGAPGLIALLTEAHSQVGGGFLQEAFKCATPIWQRGLPRKGHGLCHGTLGNAYSFVDLYQRTEDPSWLCKAVHFTEWAMGERDVGKTYDTEMGLFDGLAGVVYFYTDMLDPKTAAFPGFQLPK